MLKIFICEVQLVIIGDADCNLIDKTLILQNACPKEIPWYKTFNWKVACIQDEVHMA